MNKAVITRIRDLMITKNLLATKPTLSLYKGKSYSNIILTKRMIGHKIGEFSITKRLGAKIHDSTRNRKRRNRNKHKK